MFTKYVDAVTAQQFSNSVGSNASSFTTSVVVVPPSTLDGKYSIYPGVHDNIAHDTRSSLLKSLNYGHNINNPELRQQRFENDPDFNTFKKRFASLKMGNKSSVRSDGSLNGSCECGEFHSHIFKPYECNVLNTAISKSAETAPVLNKSPEMITGMENEMTICNIFWKANLSFCNYKFGDKVVLFHALWPLESTIKALLRDGIEEFGLRNALWELCLLSLVDGPMCVLQALLDLKFIRIDYQFEGDPGLLHLACLLRNMDAVQLLINRGITPKIKDKSGKTAEEVCFCPKISRKLTGKYHSSLLADHTKSNTSQKPGLQDKDAIFRLSSNPNGLYELQKKLQMFDFDVNLEKNKDGDYIIHIATRAGICQLPLMISLVHIQHVTVDLYNGDGFTPLMLIAMDGDSQLCDVFLCLFGSDPNKVNKKDGKTALHYGVLYNHIDIVKCLIKRGADVNIEDNDHCRPDDMVLLNSETEDCVKIVQLERSNRCERLCECVKNDVVYPMDLRTTDLSVVNADGYTLIMVAAMCNRPDNLESLLTVSADVINAQHFQTGLTALSLATKEGHQSCCDILLRNGASASIQDMHGYLPLHYAVLGNHEKLVDVFKKHFPAAYVGIYKGLRLCRKSSIHDKLTHAWERRQAEIVTPQLRICAMEGNADKLFCVLEEGDNVNSKSDLNSQPALFVAVENNHVDVIKLLVERGGDIHKRDEHGNTVLHIVSRTGHLATAKYLINFCKSDGISSSKNRLDINAVNNEKKTALQIASEKGFIKLITLLIANGATTAVLNSQGTLFTSPEYEGARVQIENHRLEHTRKVMELVEDKSKKAPMQLAKIFLPRFDHNLRDKNGDTPLMVACKLGRIETVKFLLQSAVYANQISPNDSGDDSDADSGVPDLPPWKSHPEAPIFNPDDILKSAEPAEEYGENLVLGASLTVTRSLNPGDTLNKLPVYAKTRDVGSVMVNNYLTDIERPKGLYIYHDGIVSHVCAVNLFDGNTPLHRTIEGGDYLEITVAVLEKDNAVINMQNGAGLTPVHLACKLGRKKILYHLLMFDGIDLGLLTLNGHLPEEMTTNKIIINMIKKVKEGHLPKLLEKLWSSENMQVAKPIFSTHQIIANLGSGVGSFGTSITESQLSNHSGHAGSIHSAAAGSTISFDKINSIYKSLQAMRKS